MAKNSMKRGSISPDPSRRLAETGRIRLSMFVASGLAVVGLIFLSWFNWFESTETNPPDPWGEDPRLTFQTPYLNVKPDVTYVGDSTCIHCHPSIGDSFHHHPMGLSASRNTLETSVELMDSNLTSIELLGGKLVLEVDKQTDEMIHRIRLLNEEGVPFLSDEAKIEYSIGSGTQGRTYLTVRGGCLWESPISWFRSQANWGLSPGYSFDTHFSRRITSECLYCHVDQFQSKSDTIYVYNPQLPERIAISCERCHGPGKLHVDFWNDQTAPISEIDYTIVNPKHLSPDLRDSICQQCHLMGDTRVVRRGQDIQNFRPGLPREHFWTVFVPSSQDGYRKLLGHYEQMYLSQCSLASNRELSCTSCHDPHYKPSESEKINYFRIRCNQCHQDQPCTEIETRRFATEDNCIACHMPRSNASDLAHASATDHSIPRRPLEGSSQNSLDAPSNKLRPRSTVQIQPFYPTPYAPPAIELDRDLGIAYSQLAEEASSDQPLRQLLYAESLPFLQQTYQKTPNDLGNLVNLAKVVSNFDVNQSEQIARQALAIHPADEIALMTLGFSLAEQGRFDEALATCKRLLEIVPIDYRGLLLSGQVASKQGKLKDAEQHFRLAIRYHPMKIEPRLGLIDILSRSGKTPQAESEKKTVRQLLMLHQLSTQP